MERGLGHKMLLQASLRFLCCHLQARFHLQQAAYRGARQLATNAHGQPTSDRTTSDPRNPCNPTLVTLE